MLIDAVVGNAHRILELAGTVSGAMTEAEGSAFDVIASAQHALDELAQLFPAAAAWKEEASTVAVQLQELGRTIAGEMENIETEPARLTWLDERLALYQQMKRKYGDTVEEILAVLEKSKKRLLDLETRDEQLAKLDEEIETLPTTASMSKWTYTPTE